MRRLVFFSLLSGLSLMGCSTEVEQARINPAEGSQARNSAPTRYIVSFKDSAKGLSAVHKAGGKVKLALPRHNAVAATLPAQAITGLSNNPFIEDVELDTVRVPFAETVPYGITAVQSDLLSDLPHSADGATVCIIDSGFQSTHDDLAGNPNVTSSPDIGTGDAFTDQCGHGTHVAGTVAATGGNDLGVVGVNGTGDQSLHIVKVFSNDTCEWSYSSTLIKALEECQSSTDGKLVVSMSLGGSMKNRAEQRAFDAAWDAGVLSIAAAGNDGNTRKSYPASYDSVMSVAAIDDSNALADFSQRNDQVEIAAPGVDILSTVPWHAEQSLTVNGTAYQANHIEFATLGTVSGTLADGGTCEASGSWLGQVVLCERGNISFYDKVANAEAGGAVATIVYNNESGSFFGTLGEGFASVNPAITLSQEDGQALVAAAIGQLGDVVSNIDPNGSGYEAWNGTSMATPHVSGVAAKVWENAPSATNAELRDALTATALDLGTAGRDSSYGYGLVQGADALSLLESGPSCTPTESSESSCDDGLDNDCDGLVDIADADCEVTDPGTCDLAAVGEACTVSSDCCSSNCKGKRGRKTCK